jgi:FixJ family two-component response regulator
MRLAREMPALDVLLCGLELPDMPAEELALGISAVHPATSVVFVASSYRRNDGTGAVDVLEKPFSILELRNAVRTALNVMPESSESMLLAAG